MKKIIPNRRYICTKPGYVVETKMKLRVPEQKLYPLVLNEVYKVDCKGMLETPEGLAIITGSVAEILELVRSDEEITYWQELRNKIASDVMCAILGNSKLMTDITANARSEYSAKKKLADNALVYANILVKTLEESPLWEQEQ